jgi:hypothetical protein
MLPVWETIGILNEKRRREYRPPVDSRVMRIRHCMSRYEFPEDRKNFKRWFDAPGPCSRPYRWMNEDNGRLIIDIVRSGKRLCYDIQRQELYDRNWRQVVARAVKIVRRAFYA